MHHIDSKGHKSVLKSNRNYLTNHTKYKSCYYLFMASRVYTHTRHKHTDSFTKAFSRNWVCAGLFKDTSLIVRYNS